MKYSIIVTLFILTAADKIMCPLNIDASVSCTKEYQPVCGFSSEGFQLGTFGNACLACKIEKANYYQLDACFNTTASLETVNLDSSISTSNGNTIYKCNIPKSESPICPAVFKPTCGLFVSSIQCLKEPCGRTFGNECEACSDKNIDSYFYGDCTEIPQEDPQNPPDDSIIYCTEPRPDICTYEYTDTCAFISTPCFSESCMISAGNYCDACSRKDVVGYVKQSCSKYQQIYTQDQSNLDDEETKTDTQKEELEQEYYAIQQKCSTQKPSSCDNIVKEVCASYKCNDAICQKEFQNECQACLDSTTISYSQGKCQTLSGTILSLALLIQLFI